MKPTLRTLTLLLLAGVLQVNAKTLLPVALASKGQSTVSSGSSPSAPVVLKQPLSAGSTITTDAEGRLALALGPGQMIVLHKASQVEIVSPYDDASGHGAVVQLIAGQVSCSIDPKFGHSGPVFKLLAGQQTIQAKGTAWQTGIAANGQVTNVVLSSTVNVAVAGGNFSANVSAGSVLISSYTNGGLTGAVLVNLVTGQATSYSSSGEPANAVASAAQLATASVAFQAAVNGASSEGGGGSGSAALNSLIASVNVTLNAAGISAITSPSNTGAPLGRDSTVSPEQP